MLTYIDARLKDWGLYKSGASGRSAGGMSPFPAYSLSGRGGRPGDAPPPPMGYVPLNELECAETDRCVGALEPLLRQAVEEFYWRIGGADTAADRCKCSVRTLYRRIDEAHNKLLGYLNDMAAGVVVQSWEQQQVMLNIVTTPMRRQRLTA